MIVDGPPAAPSATFLAERFAKTPEAPVNPTPVEAMAHRLRTPEGRDLYALRKQTPGAGVRHHQIRARIPSIFDMRGLEKARGESGVSVTMAWEHQANVRPQPGLRRNLSAECASDRPSDSGQGGRTALSAGKTTEQGCKPTTPDKSKTLSPTGC